MAIDPSAGFAELMKSWNRYLFANLRNENLGQGFWHAGNTLDTCVTYLIQTKQKDDQNIVYSSQRLFSDNAGKPDKPGWWRDDYGWWGIAFLNAADSAAILGLSQQTAQDCIDGADLCWQIMKFDWDANNHHGVRNNPDGGTANTVTNVLFLVLSLRRYESTKAAQALDTAKAVFDWFYAAPPPPDAPGTCGLFTKQKLIRETPSVSSDRAWTGDQGWFWRGCLDLYRLDTDPTRRNHIADVTEKLGNAVLATVFDSGVVRELPYQENYDINYATGIGVFIRQFAIINAVKTDRPWKNLIRQSAQGAWDNSDWSKDYTQYLPRGCWHSGDSEYHGQQILPFALWDLTIKTSAQDAFNAYLTVGP
jgi:hypothetical protein